MHSLSSNKRLPTGYDGLVSDQWKVVTQKDHERYLQESGFIILIHGNGRVGFQVRDGALTDAQQENMKRAALDILNHKLL